MVQVGAFAEAGAVIELQGWTHARQIYEARVPVYALADLAVDAGAQFSVDEMALRVIAALRTRPDVLEDVE